MTVAPWRPGVTQTIKVTIKHPEQKRWGFQLTARLANNLKAQAGTFTVSPDIRVRCLSGPDAPCNGDVEFASHKSAVVTDVGSGYTYSVDWTPPATAVGDIVFYLAGNAADGNGALTNDRIYTTSMVLSPASCALSGVPTVTSAVSAASFKPSVSPNSIISIFGTGFQTAGLSRQILPEDLGSNLLPSTLSCVAVEVNKVRAPLLYAGPTQINAVIPSGTAAGATDVRVILNPTEATPIASSSITVQTAALAPNLFTIDGTRAAAQFSNTSTLVADPTVVTGSKPAKTGDLVTFYASGLGDTAAHVDAAALPGKPSATTNAVTVMLNGTALPPANVTYAGVTPGMCAGLYQVNITIPAGVTTGDSTLKVLVNGASSQDGVTIRTSAQ